MEKKRNAATNTLARALQSLAKSKTALPEFLLELRDGLGS